MTKFTANEAEAVVALIKSCLVSMGGKTLSDLDGDPHTWVDAADLMDAGWGQKEAEGTFGSLVAKGYIVEDEPKSFFISHDDASVRRAFLVHETSVRLAAEIFATA